MKEDYENKISDLKQKSEDRIKELKAKIKELEKELIRLKNHYEKILSENSSDNDAVNINFYILITFLEV